ncbi:tetratricopeptide repeat protein [Rhizobium rhizogenes]
MGAEERLAEACSITDEEARSEFERLLLDSRFHATERSRLILSYLAERHFSGHEDAVKAYTIAIDVLGRPSNFDASTDPIVRIEISRLRSFLDQYYEAYKGSGVAIDIPTGRYVVRFSRCHVSHQDEVGAGTDDTVRNEADTGPSVQNGFKARARPSRKLILCGSVGASIAVVLGGLIALYAQRPVLTQKPVVVLNITAADQALGPETGLTKDYLMTALMRFNTLSFASLRTTASRNIYSVDIKYYSDDDDRTAWWQVSSPDGDILKSGIETVSLEGRSPAAARDELVSALARRLGSSRGVISNIEMHRAPAGALGNACILRVEHDLDERGLKELANEDGCLKQTIARNPTDAEAIATLARAKLAADPGNVKEALDLANRAVSIAPTSDRANIALMSAQFLDGRSAAAIEIGNKALALNPSNPEISAKLGAVMFATGFYESAVSLASDAAKAADGAPRDAMLVLALDAYRRGNWSDASLLSEQITCNDFVVSALRAASLGQLGSPEAQQRLEDLRKRTPDFERGFSKRMAGIHYAPTLTVALQDGLKMAGAHFVPEQFATK